MFCSCFAVDKIVKRRKAGKKSKTNVKELQPKEVEKKDIRAKEEIERGVEEIWQTKRIEENSQTNAHNQPTCDPVKGMEIKKDVPER